MADCSSGIRSRSLSRVGLKMLLSSSITACRSVVQGTSTKILKENVQWGRRNILRVAEGRLTLSYISYSEIARASDSVTMQRLFFQFSS